MLLLERAVFFINVKYNLRCQFLYKSIVIGGFTKCWRRRNVPRLGVQHSLFIKLSLCLLLLFHHPATWKRFSVSFSSAPSHILIISSLPCCSWESQQWLSRIWLRNWKAQLILSDISSAALTKIILAPKLSPQLFTHFQINFYL